jgi:hypothetical protein
LGVDTEKLARQEQGRMLGANTEAHKDGTVATKTLTSSVDNLTAAITGQPVGDSTVGTSNSLPALVGPDLGLANALPGGSSGSSKSGLLALLAGGGSTAGAITEALRGNSISGDMAAAESTAAFTSKLTSNRFLSAVAGVGSGAARGIVEGNPLGAAIKGSNVYIGNGRAANYTTSQRVGAGIEAAGAVYGGVQGVIGGIREGGARGITSAIGSAAGAAAALDPEPISKAILAGVALSASVVKGLFGDPKAE